MMIEPWGLAGTLISGLLLGGMFFGGLWWTVRQAVSSRWVALWFLASMALRTGLVLLGFYVIAGSDWQRWLAGLLGFTLARSIVTYLTREVADAP